VLVVITFTTVQYAEGALGWNGFLKEIGFGGSQVYEISREAILRQGETATEEFRLFCLEGDTLYIARGTPNNEIFTTLEAGTEFRGLATPLDPQGGQTSLANGAPHIGAIFRGEITDAETLEPIPSPGDFMTKATIICLSPSSLLNAVGGEWHATDTTALIIGYSVLNMYWIAPIGIGIGVGVYLTRNRWQRR